MLQQYLFQTQLLVGLEELHRWEVQGDPALSGQRGSRSGGCAWASGGHLGWPRLAGAGGHLPALSLQPSALVLPETAWGSYRSVQDLL